MCIWSREFCCYVPVANLFCICTDVNFPTNNMRLSRYIKEFIDYYLEFRPKGLGVHVQRPHSGMCFILFAECLGKSFLFFPLSFFPALHMAPADSASIVPTTIGQGGDIWGVRSVKLHSTAGDNGAQAVTAFCVDTCSIETRPLSALSMGCVFVSWHFPLVFLHVFKIFPWDLRGCRLISVLALSNVHLHSEVLWWKVNALAAPLWFTQGPSNHPTSSDNKCFHMGRKGDKLITCWKVVICGI